MADRDLPQACPRLYFMYVDYEWRFPGRGARYVPNVP